MSVSNVLRRARARCCTFFCISKACVIHILQLVCKGVPISRGDNEICKYVLASKPPPPSLLWMLRRMDRMRVAGPTNTNHTLSDTYNIVYHIHCVCNHPLLYSLSLSLCVWCKPSFQPAKSTQARTLLQQSCFHELLSLGYKLGLSLSPHPHPPTIPLSPYVCSSFIGVCLTFFDIPFVVVVVSLPTTHSSSIHTRPRSLSLSLHPFVSRARAERITGTHTLTHIHTHMVGWLIERAAVAGIAETPLL